jgi:ribosomal peptide maturation radical SAM protein 1
MAYRSKTAGRALEELSYLSRKYPGLPLRAADNILEVGYFKDFIPGLAERIPGLSIFYEVKSNLKKEQLREMRDAGITTIQPGIESLSDRVLQIMRKGVKALQNIQLLKWCKELHVTPEWNLLWGFPGEPEEEYARMAELVPLLSHLQPPIIAVTIRMDRFSPNFNQAEQWGLRNLLPYPAYRYVYPFPDEVVANLAYYFTFEYDSPQDVTGYTRELQQAIAEWRECYERSALFWVESDDRLLIWDSRPIGTEPLTIFTGREKHVYLSCDQVKTPQQILRLCRSHCDESIEMSDIMSALESFIARKIMIRNGDSYLALAAAGLPLSSDGPTITKK